MATLTPLNSFNKRLNSIRLALAALFSGRVSARLAELEERVFELEQRANAQADVVANIGTNVAVEMARSTVFRVLRNSQKHQEGSDGKLSAKAANADGLRSNRGFSGGRNNSNRAEYVDDGSALISHQLDGMRLDTIPARPATSDLPPAVTKVVA